MFLRSGKKSKFRYESKAATTLKIVCLFLVLASPLIVFQIVIFNANRSPARRPPVSKNYEPGASNITLSGSKDVSTSELFEIGGQPSTETRREDNPEFNFRLRRSPTNVSAQLESIPPGEVRSQAEGGGSESENITPSIDRIDREDQIIVTSSAHDGLHNNKTESSLDEGSESGPRTMVMVSSRVGNFSELVPLDDLVVAPASDDDKVSNNRQDLEQQMFQQLSQPHLQFVQQLADKSQPPLDESQLGFADNLNQANHRLSSRLLLDADLAALHSYHLNQQQRADEVAEGNTEPEVAGLEQMPDSFEGLMQLGERESGLERSGAEEEITRPMQQDSSANRQIGQAISSGDDDEQEEEDQEDTGGPEPDEIRRIVDTSPVSTTNRQISNPIPTSMIESSGDGEEDEDRENNNNYLSHHEDGKQLMAAGYPIVPEGEDLKAAAGHHYKKKKKKVKKYKKKKIVIKKKKKKKKKLKKIKIIKYKKKKKKKIVIKKKKKKKHHYPKKHHHDHGKYYMYAKVPKKKSWEFGFKKGNKKHWIERHEKGHKNKFKTKVKWYDKKSKGKGLHIWDYNHHDKKKKKHYG